MTAHAEKTAAVLPDKPSELLTIALEDLRRIERSKKYVVNMRVWHHKASEWSETPDKCEVCLAGAVMARRLGASPDADMWPEDFSGKVESKLDALNEFRGGRVGCAFGLLRRSRAKGERFDREITPYDADPAAFKRELRQLAADLAAAGF